MENIYWVEEWANIRQKELVRYPDSFRIHQCYLECISQEDFEIAFKEIWNIFDSIYADVAKFPENFGMPLYEIEHYNSFTTQARESRQAPYRPINLLYNLLISSSFNNRLLLVDINNFKALSKIKHTNKLIERLNDYGFSFDGLKNYKVSNENILMSYPKNENVIYVLKLMADKAKNINRLNDFLSCHYKLFQDDMNTVNYGNGVDIVADKMHTKEERDFIYSMDYILCQMGYYAQVKLFNEGPAYAYYDRESVMKSNGPYHYMLISWKTRLMLFMRIRNATKCLDYIEQCSATVKEIFLWGDNGCKNRFNGTVNLDRNIQLMVLAIGDVVAVMPHFIFIQILKIYYII